MSHDASASTTESAPVIRMPGLHRIVVTGRDRAKFLHSFCTNDVKSLTPGSACEAFFTDLKARVIAHGFVLTLDESIEVWLLGCPTAALCRHLRKYVITDDVVLEECPEVELIASKRDPPSSDGALPTTADTTQPRLLQCIQGTSGGTTETPRATELLVEWSHQLLALRASHPAVPRRLEVSHDGLSTNEFERLRIQEQFPIVGVDVDADHLAPEVGRDDRAISYRKGCYLGQEPIARLDALGHVNRSLRVVLANVAESITGAKVVGADGREVGRITSDAPTDSGGRAGLAVLRLSALASAIRVELPNGECIPAVLQVS